MRSGSSYTLQSWRSFGRRGTGCRPRGRCDGWTCRRRAATLRRRPRPGVAPAHPVVGDHHRLHPGLGQEPQAQPDVEHDLDVDPGWSDMPKRPRSPGPCATRRAAPRRHSPLEQRLEPAVATGWGADPGALIASAGVGGARRTGGAIGFPGAVNAHERSVSGAEARQPAFLRRRARMPSGPRSTVAGRMPRGRFVCASCHAPRQAKARRPVA